MELLYAPTEKAELWQVRQQNRRRKALRRRLEAQPEKERPLILALPEVQDHQLIRDVSTVPLSTFRASVLFSFALITDTHYWQTSAVRIAHRF